MSQTSYPSMFALLKKYELQPKKGLGQNFLVDPNHLRKIIAAAQLSPNDQVLEIGPGLGALSVLLCQAAQNVLALDLDPAMIKVLQTELAAYPNFWPYAKAIS